MKFTVILLLLAAYSQAAEVASSRRQQKTVGDSKTEKRALAEGNAGVEKRAPVLPTPLPSATPGIEYADSKEYNSEKSPQQQVYATPVPQLAKISDVLTGQGPPYQAAIASHLFSPISIYQPRLASPTYEVSAPVPSQLAYTEKITYQPQTPEQITPQVYKLAQKQTNFPRFTLQPVQQYQQLQPQPFKQYQAQQFQQAQQLQQVQPQVFPLPYQPQLVYNPQPIQYQTPIQFSQQPVTYVQQQPTPTPAQPGIVYVQQESNENQRPIQRELKTAPIQTNTQTKPEQNYNTQNQGAVSFASFSVGPAAPAPTLQHQNQPQQQNQPKYQPQTQTNPQPQPLQHQTQQYQPQQYQTQQYQPQQYETQPTQPEIQSQHQYQIQRLPQFNPQYQNLNQYQSQQQHVQIQPQIIQKLEPSPSNSVAVPSKPVPLNNGKQITYLRPEPVAYQPQVYAGQEFFYQNAYGSQPLAVPTFPPVQFFGKYAQSIFRNYQQ